MGLIMPRHAGLTDDVSRRLEDFVVMVLLPLFFIITGLRTEVGSLNRPVLWLITLGLIAVAIVGKWVGAMVAARYGGFGLRESAAIGALMNTRGLTELIVLNIGLELGLVSPTLFTMLVIMALVTTFMAGPGPAPDRSPEALLLAARGRGARGMAAEGVEPRHSIVVSAQDEKNLDALLAIAEPLASIGAAAGADHRAPGRHAGDRNRPGLRRARAAARNRGGQRRGATCSASEESTPAPSRSRHPTPARTSSTSAPTSTSTSCSSTGAGLCSGPGVPGGEIGAALERAPCDVGVLVEREGLPTIDAQDPVVIPFGGAEHDWAALELGSWIAAARGAPLKLLGASAENGEGRDASRLLANASLVVQQLAGIAAEPVLDEARRRGDPGVRRAPACSSSGSPSAGARRASGRSAPRSSRRPPRRSCSSAAARGPARWLRVTT